MTLLAIYLFCATTVIDNRSTYPWGTDLDLQTFRRATKKCARRGKCLAKLIKIAERDYYASCGRFRKD